MELQGSQELLCLIWFRIFFRALSQERMPICPGHASPRGNFEKGTFYLQDPPHHHPLWHPLPAYLYPPPTTNNNKSLAPDPHSSQDMHTCNCLPVEHLFWAHSSLEVLRARNRAHLKTDPSWVPSPEDHPFAPRFISKIA